MKLVIVKLIAGLVVITAAVFSTAGCDDTNCPDVYLAEDSGCYLDLVSDYSEIVSESEWGC